MRAISALCIWFAAFAFLKCGPAGGFIAALFCRPAAFLCGLYLGVAPEPLADGGASISSSAGTLLVVPSCSATTFFLLLSLGMLHVAISRERGLKLALLALAMSYLIAIALNSCRLVCVWECLMAFGSSPFGLPGPLFHYLLGAAIFWPMLIAAPFAFHKILKSGASANEPFPS